MGMDGPHINCAAGRPLFREDFVEGIMIRGVRQPRPFVRVLVKKGSCPAYVTPTFNAPTELQNIDD